MKSYKISCVVVLFNPDDSIFESISSVFDEVDCLLIVDNSTIKNYKILKKLRNIKGVEYIDNKENLGVARALNIGAEKAIEKKSDFLLTMDQDSIVEKGMLEKMLRVIDRVGPDSIGIVSPQHVYKKSKNKIRNLDFEDRMDVMTSGNLLNLQVYLRVGPFLEKLFIDYVDVEYCLRLNLNSYRVIQVNSARLIHKLGNTKNYKFCMFRFHSTNHSPFRRYYISRNRLFVYSLYKHVFPEYCSSILRAEALDLLKIIFFENKKFNKIFMSIKGYLDYRKNIFGKMGREDI